LALREGILIGLVTGIMWVIEISFNNVLPPEISTGTARFYVDNGFWVAIMLVMLVASALSASRHRSILLGLQIGAWSGLISGLMACLMGSLLVTFWMPLLLRDPLNIQEFTERGVASGAPNLATYFAYETLTGSVGHLIILGPIMGGILGLLGGCIGRFLRLPGSRASQS
jgi:hypothetical protein